MPKVKIPRSSAHVDMTAMCDVAFLLLTFFILATKVKPVEPVVIRTPASTSTIPLPSDVILITLTQDGKVFFDVDNINTRKAIINDISTNKGLNLTQAQKDRFVELSNIPVPFNQLPAYLNLSATQATEYDKTAAGIPADSTGNYDNELAYWIKTTRYQLPNARIAIKADGNAAYPQIQKVIGTLGSMKIFRFNFITDSKGIPAGSALANEMKVVKK